MKLKKLAIIPLALGLSFGAVACSQPSDNTNITDSAEAAKSITDKEIERLKAMDPNILINPDKSEEILGKEDNAAETAQNEALELLTKSEEVSKEFLKDKEVLYLKGVEVFLFDKDTTGVYTVAVLKDDKECMVQMVYLNDELSEISIRGKEEDGMGEEDILDLNTAYYGMSNDGRITKLDK